MFLLIDNYDSFTYNLVQAFYALGHKPVVLRNDDPSVLDMEVNPELSMGCISRGPGHPADAAQPAHSRAGRVPWASAVGAARWGQGRGGPLHHARQTV